MSMAEVQAVTMAREIVTRANPRQSTAIREGLMDADGFLDKVNLSEQLLPLVKTLSLEV